MQGFFAYPSSPSDIGEVVTSAAQHIDGMTTWEQLDIPGRFLIDPIFEKIVDADYLAADITKLNFNVSYEIGFAIGKQRRVILVKSGAIDSDTEAIRDIGIFDTIGYKTYTTSAQLKDFFRGINDIKPLSIDF